jgi:hypothetical protein
MQEHPRNVVATKVAANAITVHLADQTRIKYDRAPVETPNFKQRVAQRAASYRVISLSVQAASHTAPTTSRHQH